MSDILSVNILGSGNVATHVGRRLQERGLRIGCVCSHTYAHACRLAETLGHVPYSSAIGDMPSADAYLISVKDSALESVAEELHASLADTDALMIHTAGSMPIESLTKWFRNVAVLYPMQTFSLARNVDFSTIPVFVEASNNAARKQVLHLAHLLSERVYQLSSAERRTLHLAAVFACNFTNHCYALAYEMLENADIDPTILLPLISETANKVNAQHPRTAQTGPAVRWDKNVIEKHQELLASQPELQKIYEVMSQSIHHKATTTP